MNTQTDRNKRLGALDIFIILALIVCIVSVGWRYFSTKSDNANAGAVMQDYIVSFEIYNIRESSAVNFLNEGTEFYIAADNSFFGTLREKTSTVPAEKYYTSDEGQVVLVTNTGTGEQYRVDFAGKMTCSGVLNENRSFLLNGNQYLAVDKEIPLYSKYLAVTIKITDISPDVSVN